MLYTCTGCGCELRVLNVHSHDLKQCFSGQSFHHPRMMELESYLLPGENNRVLFFWYLIFQSAELAVFFKEGILGISLLKPSVVLMVGLLFIAIFFLMVRGSESVFLRAVFFVNNIGIPLLSVNCPNFSSAK